MTKNRITNVWIYADKVAGMAFLCIQRKQGQINSYALNSQARQFRAFDFLKGWAVSEWSRALVELYDPME